MPCLYTEKVVRDALPLRTDTKNPKTFGEIIDEAIKTALVEHAVLQRVAIDFSPEEWDKYADAERGKYADPKYADTARQKSYKPV